MTVGWGVRRTTFVLQPQKSHINSAETVFRIQREYAYNGLKPVCRTNRFRRPNVCDAVFSSF